LGFSIGGLDATTTMATTTTTMIAMPIVLVIENGQTKESIDRSIE